MKMIWSKLCLRVAILSAPVCFRALSQLRRENAGKRWWRTTLTVKATGRVPWQTFRGRLRQNSKNKGYAVIAQEALCNEWLGWRGKFLQKTCKSLLTFYPSTTQHRTVYSDTAHKNETAVVRPSVALWSWLGSNLNSEPWQVSFH